MHTDTRHNMCQLALLFGSLLLLLCATENEASKYDCKAAVNDFYNLHCIDVIKEKRARKDHLRKTRDIVEILEENASRNNGSPMIGLQDFLTQSRDGRGESTKFVEFQKRNSVHSQRGSLASMSNKASNKCGEDLLGLNIGKGDLEELDSNDAVPRHTRQLPTTLEEKILRLFEECCPDEHECFDKFKHLRLRECHPKYKHLRKP